MEQDKPTVFTPVSSFPLKLSLPMIYPGQLFTFHLRVQLVRDAEIAQRNFVMLPDDEKHGDAFHQFDVAMLSSLSTAPPEGFPDFPEYPDAFEVSSEPPSKEAWLKQAVREYFYPNVDGERREGMRFICRRAMALYFQAIQPDQYL